MATTDFDFLLTRNELIEQSYRKLGVLVEGESLTAQQIDDGVKRLNLIVNEWTNDGVFLWEETLQSTPLVIGQATYVLPSDPAILSVSRAYIRKSGKDGPPLEYLSWIEYQDTTDKASVGIPQYYSIDPRNGIIYLWPVPSSADTLYYIGISRLKDWDDAAGSGDIPARWQRALFYALVADLCEDFPTTVAAQQKFDQKAGVFYQRARANESDNSDREHIAGAYD